VQARRPSPAQRLGKWVRRHRGLVRLGAAAVAVALVGLLVGLVLLLQANDRLESQKQQTQDQLARAQTNVRLGMAALAGAQITEASQVRSTGRTGAR